MWHAAADLMQIHRGIDRNGLQNISCEGVGFEVHARAHHSLHDEFLRKQHAVLGRHTPQKRQIRLSYQLYKSQLTRLILAM